MDWRSSKRCGYCRCRVYNPPLSEKSVKHKIALGLLPFWLTSALITAAPQSSVQANCNRECLRGAITQYLDAMVAHNPKSLPLAANVRFTEDTKTMPVGEGLWKGVSKLRSYRQD